jgi:hypothetical protein
MYISGKRIGPGSLRFPVNEEKDMLFGDREKGNFLWSILRFCASPEPLIPSWTGFNITVLDGVPILQSTIRYLDCIDAPATDTSTIYQVYYTWTINYYVSYEDVLICIVLTLQDHCVKAEFHFVVK